MKFMLVYSGFFSREEIEITIYDQKLKYTNYEPYPKHNDQNKCHFDSRNSHRLNTHLFVNEHTVFYMSVQLYIYQKNIMV